MSAPWYYRRQGLEAGPLTVAEMRKAAAEGVVTPETEVRHGATGAWCAASTVKGLLDGSDTSAGNPVSPAPQPLWFRVINYVQMALIGAGMLVTLCGMFVTSEASNLWFAAGCGLTAVGVFLQTFAVFVVILSRKRRTVSPQNGQ